MKKSALTKIRHILQKKDGILIIRLYENGKITGILTNSRMIRALYPNEIVRIKNESDIVEYLSKYLVDCNYHLGRDMYDKSSLIIFINVANISFLKQYSVGVNDKREMRYDVNRMLRDNREKITETATFLYRGKKIAEQLDVPNVVAYAFNCNYKRISKFLEQIEKAKNEYYINDYMKAEILAGGNRTRDMLRSIGINIGNAPVKKLKTFVVQRLS